MDAASQLRDAARLGAFFAVEIDPSGPGWRPFADLLADASHLQAQVAAARAMLAGRAGVASQAIDARASASIQHLGTVARLASPLLAVAAATGRAPRVTTQTVFWRPLPGGPVEFALQPDGAAPLEAVLAELAEPLGDAFASSWQLSAHIVRGNLASALAGAATMLRNADPQLGSAGEHLVRQLLATRLRGSGTWPEGGTFRRHNCCLFYRIPAAGTCGDCVLNSRSAKGANTSASVDHNSSAAPTE